MFTRNIHNDRKWKVSYLYDVIMVQYSYKEKYNKDIISFPFCISITEWIWMNVRIAGRRLPIANQGQVTERWCVPTATHRILYSLDISWSPQTETSHLHMRTSGKTVTFDIATLDVYLRTWTSTRANLHKHIAHSLRVQFEETHIPTSGDRKMSLAILGLPVKEYH